jgi:O-antigen ligase
VLLLAVVASGDFGGLREVGTWIAGALFALVVAISLAEGTLDARGPMLALVIVSAVLGLGAVLERLASAEVVTGLIPDYQPYVRTFAVGLGDRASSWAGHPLRLGTVTMLGCLSGLHLLTHRAGSRMLLTAATLLGAGGLLLSGARGSWLGLAVGAGMMVVGGGSRTIARRVVLAAVLVLAAYSLASLTGIDRLVVERIGGSAVDVGSLGQRADVLRIAWDVWREKPVLGHGLRALNDAIYARGLNLANYENEYLGMLFGAGVLGFAAFGVVLARTIRLGFSGLREPECAALVGLWLSAAVNIGTYNMFSWSAGPVLFLTLAVLARRGCSLCE